MTRYLVTGGTGFVGANLVRRLVHSNAKVHLIIEPDCDWWRLQDVISSCSLSEISLTDFEQISLVVKVSRPDVIFHLASYGGMPGQNDQKKIYDVNFSGTVNLLNACKKNGFDCFINTGSSSEYGIKNNIMCEDDVLQPVSDYAVSKAAATQFCTKEALFNKLPVYTVRPFSVYGDFEAPTRLIPSILCNALKKRPIKLSSPNFVRDFIYVHDLVNFYINLSGITPEQNDVFPERHYVFNAGSGDQSSIKDVVDTVQSFFDYKLDVVWGASETRPWEPKRWQSDIVLAMGILDWEPRCSLKKGIEKSLRWFKKNIDLPVSRSYVERRLI